MKLIPALLLSSLLLPTISLAATPSNVLGRVLLQVEDRGQAWYVNPLTGERIYLPNGNSAYSLLWEQGLGITNADLSKIPIAVEERFEESDLDDDGLSDHLEEALGTNPDDADSDNDGHLDGTEVLSGYDPTGSDMVAQDPAFTTSLKGRILLQVESRGEAWYVNPEDEHRYYVHDGDAAYQVMRYLSLGITNADLEQIAIYQPPARVPLSLAMFIELTNESAVNTDSVYDEGTAFETAKMGISYGEEAFKGMVIYRYAREGVEGHHFENVVGMIEDVSFEEWRGEEFMKDLSGTAFKIAEGGTFTVEEAFEDIDAYGIAIQVTSCERMEDYFEKACEEITAEDLAASADEFPVDESKAQGFHVKDPTISDTDWRIMYQETHPSGTMDWFFDEVAER